MKKVSELVLIIFLLVYMSIEVGAVSRNFTDVKTSDWFYENVCVLVEEEIIEGYSDGSFRPDNSIQIDEFIKTMVVALGYKLEEGESYWASTYIDKAIELGIVINGEFDNYNKVINRAEMARMCERVINKLEGVKTYTKTQAIINSTPDKNDIEKTGLSNYIYHMYEIGIIAGYNDKSFKPNNVLTRAEASTVIRRIIDENIREAFCSEEYVEISEGTIIPNAFSINLQANEPLEPQWEEAEAYLINKVGKEKAKEMMAYVKQKKDVNDELKNKAFGKYKDVTLFVISGKGNNLILIGSGK